jgi:Fur family ferric uptake transcriptional regulator
MNSMDDLAIAGERRLRAASRRITPQRRLILDTLAQAGGHLDAGEIYERARLRDPRLSLSTIYRTLTALKASGAVRELHLDQEHHHYELDNDDRHSHLVCMECGRVIEVDSEPFAQVAQAVGQSHGFDVAAAQVELTGRCADCRQKQT